MGRSKTKSKALKIARRARREAIGVPAHKKHLEAVVARLQEQTQSHPRKESSSTTSTLARLHSALNPKGAPTPVLNVEPAKDTEMETEDSPVAAAPKPPKKNKKGAKNKKKSRGHFTF